MAGTLQLLAVVRTQRDLQGQDRQHMKLSLGQAAVTAFQARSMHAEAASRWCPSP